MYCNRKIIKQLFINGHFCYTLRPNLISLCCTIFNFVLFHRIIAVLLICSAIFIYVANINGFALKCNIIILTSWFCKVIDFSSDNIT